MKACVGQRLLLVALATLYGQHCAHADEAIDHSAMHMPSSSEFVLFLSGEAHHFTTPASESELNEDAPLIADAVFALNKDKFRLFGEYQISREEHDLERFQVGYEPTPDTLIWLGRFHQPASAWNTEHHHGRYLQTAITRPSVELWEDEGGIFPQHITGLYVDSRLQTATGAGLHLAAAAGLGTVVEAQGLSEYDLLKPNARGRRLSLTARIAYLPAYVATNEFGLLLAHHTLPVQDRATASRLGASEIEQSIYGVFANWSNAAWRINSAVYELQMRLTGIQATRSEDLLAGYLQVERQLQHHLTLYAREETSSRAGDSRYVTINHPDFELRRTTGGVRWDLWRHQAITVEMAHGRTLHANQSEYRLQWSAALP